MITTKAVNEYHPKGHIQDLFYAKDAEVVTEGPAGTGKSLGWLHKVHVCAEKYDGCRIAIVRKTRVSLTETGLVTFEKHVACDHPVLSFPNPVQRGQRQSYKYANGSEVIVAGIDKPLKLMSADYDMIYVQEATELSLKDWEFLTTRLRNGVIPEYQQLVGDCNPDVPWHWLNQRMLSGICRSIKTDHTDNPTLWDEGTNDWTPFGVKYISKLDNLTGARKLRLRYGKWAAAEGIIYEGWDPSIHIKPRPEVPDDYTSWPVIWTVDFGFINPFVWQQWRIDPDGGMWRDKEIYHTKRLVEDHCKVIRRVTRNDPEPDAIICDHDAEDRATLEKHLSVRTKPAYKKVKPGIQAVQERLRIAENGRPRIYYVTEALIEEDDELKDEFKPTCTEQEYDGYTWDNSNVQEKNEYPVKADDHGMDGTRYGVAHFDCKGKRKLKVRGR